MGEPDQCESENQETDHGQGLEWAPMVFVNEVLCLTEPLDRHPRVYVDERGKISATPPYKDNRVRTRGLPETECRQDTETGELRCEHLNPDRAPGNLDCRWWWCPHALEMRTRLVQRHRLAVALEKRRREGTT